MVYSHFVDIQNLLIALGVAVLALFSGMLGFGVALAVVAQSLTAFLYHAPTAQIDGGMVAITALGGVVGSSFGARFTSKRLGGAQVRWVFALMMGAMMLYRATMLLIR